jgi:hypothetical protein
MVNLSQVEFEFDNVVLGWGHPAVTFARTNNYHLIVNSEQRPFHYLVGYQDVKSEWLDAIYNLGMSGHLPIPFGVENISFEDTRLKVVTKGNTKVLIRFKKLHIFDLDNFAQLEVREVVEDHVVYDIFDLIQGSRLGADFTLVSGDSFVKSIRFVTSNRIDRNTGGDFKDIIVRSVIPDADLKSFDFSETVARIFLERKLKEHKIQTDNGTTLKVRHSYRHTMKNNFHFEVVNDLDPRIILHG